MVDNGDDLEIPLGKRTKKYRLFEMVPAILSYGAIFLLVILSFVSPILAAIYLMFVIITLVVKAVGIAYHTIMGNRMMQRAQSVDWMKRLGELERPEFYSKNSVVGHLKEFGHDVHMDNLEKICSSNETFPKPSDVYNVAIIATYNETYDTLGPTMDSIIKTTYDKDRLIIVIAYEARGGAAIEKTVKLLKKNYSDKFFDLLLVKHPKDLPGEVVGKGGNITYAGKYLKTWLDKKSIDYENVIVTTLDSDNRPHKTYFDYVTYEYIVHEDRNNLSYQPISLFLNNIWDAPAPMRVVATGNSFWNIISSMRPHALRNFASHSQPMKALVGMNFWSTRTIVEDGHQYWRSYFYFKGEYSVYPIYVPIYQDAVLSDTYRKTLKAQFVQLRRWAYGASDVPYVAVRLFTTKIKVPFFEGMGRFIRLLDGHITLASVSIIVAVGGWIPLLINSRAFRDPIVHQLPDVIGVIQRVAMIGLFIMIFVSLKLLPARPERYKRRRTVLMVLQWFLMPLTAIFYSSLSAFYSQTRLMFGRYLDKFDVTDKATASLVKIKNKKRFKSKRK